MAEKRERYLYVHRVAEILDCSDDFVYSLVKDGKLRAIRIGVRSIRVSESSLHELIRSSEINPQEYSA